MTITIDFPPEVETKLLARAAETGKDVSTLVREAVAEQLLTAPPTFQEILAPVHEDFRRSGMREADLDHLLEATVAEVRRERRGRRDDHP